ncbi:helix-turn-helix transcriptional regulator [Natrarchaeobaculum aegyptiacum]|uniref:HTH iclR-type domain-containing protein n=1 Tax=Natrarchaeobaculum aegyptiacum TaxID=745377 RepID=A0A2Z2HUB7_9EURY|nr:hypothetical protein [Natrarchaeobaculum aegyptiacum]ARS89735.1 hypothetical protein B1756_08270 [Natrarchaeobaculum aegyptiacum]
MDSKGRRVLWWALVVVVACNLVAASPVAAVSAEAIDDVAFQTGEQPQSESELEPEPAPQLDHESDLAAADEVHVDVFLHENGTATFTVDYRFGNASSDDWESLRTDVEENASSYAEAEAADWNQVLEGGQNETNREMSLSNVSVATRESPAPRDMGHVTYTFQWTGFSHVEPALIEAGDALAGFTLVDDTTLQFSWPEEYTARDVSPSPDSPPDGSVLWNGDETEFTDDQPSVVLIENGGTAIGPAESGDDQPPTWTIAIAAVAVLLLAAATGWWVSRRHGQRSGPAAKTDAAGPSPHDATAPGATGVAEEDRDRRRPGSNDEQSTAGTMATRTQPSSPPPELLSNEERVMRLLEQRGGRIKQQEVVTQLDWTEAKTSQVVTSLREDDEIEVFRVGRENVLSLPEDDDT